jgi:hypothetical protein
MNELKFNWEWIKTQRKVNLDLTKNELKIN